MAMACLIGCGSDPILERAGELEGADKPASASVSVEKPSDASPPKAKQAPAQEAKSEPSPEEGANPGTHEAQPSPDGGSPGRNGLSKGSKIVISGKIIIDDWSGNGIRIDIFDGDQRNLDGPRPSVISTERVEKPGDYSIRIDKVDKDIWIGGYVDDDGDGKPGEGDPSGWSDSNPVAGSESHEGIDLRLSPPKGPQEEKPEEASEEN
jgi:hypothetical protein